MFIKKKVRRIKFSNEESIYDEEKISFNHNNIINKKQIFYCLKKYIYLGIIIIIFSIFILLVKLILNAINNSNINDDIYDIQNFDKLKNNGRILTREEAIKSGITYMKRCLDGILSKKNTLNLSINPLITVVIPCLNCAKYIKNGVRSIQNQNFIEFNIIIVSDGSDINTINVLKELSNEDRRIKIIYNNKTMGISYSRNIGALSVKSKYTIVLDSDDLFLDYDIFAYLYNIAEKENLDIVGFKAFDGNDITNKDTFKDNDNNNQDFNNTLYQPDLSCHIVIKEGKTEGNDFLIWGKLYRSLVYKSAINALGEQRYININWEEDVILVYLITIVANSYKFIQKYGYFHYTHGDTITSTLNDEKKNYFRIYKIEIFFDFGKKLCKYSPVLELIEVKRFLNQQIDDNTKNLIKRIIKKMLINDDVEDKYKNELKKAFKDYFPDIDKF